MSAGGRRLGLTLLASVLLVAPAKTAMATGINLFWNDCSLGPTATTNQYFACDTNVGSHVLMGSFVPPAGLTQVNGMFAILDLTSDTCPMPDWWQFKNIGSCRRTALSARPVPAAGQVACGDLWHEGLASTDVTAFFAGLGGNYRRVRIATSTALPSGSEGPAAAGTEYYAFNLVIQNANTVGPAACTGCDVGVCIVLSEMKLTQLAGTPGGSPIITNPLASNFVAWQSGNLSCPTGKNPVPDCTTPAFHRTWGQIKSLYR